MKIIHIGIFIANPMMITITSRMSVIVYTVQIRSELSVNGETIHQRPASELAECLNAAALGPMRGVPRSRTLTADAADLVAVSDDRVAVSTRPIAARHIASRGRAIGVRSGQNVVEVREHKVSVLVERGPAAKLISRSVQILETRRNLHSFRVEPRTSADSIASIDCAVAGISRTQVGTPYMFS